MIVKVMKDLAHNNPPIYHGHLTPDNILIDKDGKHIKIIDLGFLFLKKYFGVKNGYSNKTQVIYLSLNKYLVYKC